MKESITNIYHILVLSVRLLFSDFATPAIFFGMPIAMMILLGAAINTVEPTLRLDVINLDVDESGQPTELSAAFIEQLRFASSETDTVIICVYSAEDNTDECELSGDNLDEKDMTTRLEENIATAAIVIPLGFDANLRDNQSVSITYKADPDLNAGTITETTTNTAIDRFAGSVMIANEIPDDFSNTLTVASQELQTPPAQLSLQSSGDTIVVGEGANQSVPGTGTMFVFMALLALAGDLIAERERGTLQRLMVLPIRRYQIVIGKILGRYVLGLIQFAVFIIVGILLDVNWGDQYLVLGLIILIFCFTSTTLGFLLATFAKTSDQAISFATFIGLTMAPIGGAWFSFDLMPDILITVGYASPITWAMRAFNEVIYYDGNIGDILPMLGVLLIMAAAFVTLGIMRFKYEQ